MRSIRVACLLLGLMMVVGVVAYQGPCYGSDDSATQRVNVKPELGPIGTPIGRPIDLEGNPRLEGIAFDDNSEKLFVLNDVDNDADGDGLIEKGEEIQIYSYDQAAATLSLDSSFTVPIASDTRQVLTNARGLTFAEEQGRRILYTLSSRHGATKDADGKVNFYSHLWRIDLTNPKQVEVETVDLIQDVFDLRGAEVFDVACDSRGRIFISFDAVKGAANLGEQRARGVLRFRAQDGAYLDQKILPSSGKTPDHHALGLAAMEMDGHVYLLGTIEELTNNTDQEIYAAEAETGRGLFKFPAPPITGDKNTERRLAYGAGVLWVGQQREGLDQVQRVVIKDNLYKPRIGYKRPRRIQVTITSRVVCPEGENRGEIIHNFGHPLSNAILPSQGGYPEGHTLRMEAPATKDGPAQEGAEKTVFHTPLNDLSSRSKIAKACYPASTKNHGLFKSVFEEDFWTREYRHFVYPHLTSNDLGMLKDTDYRLGHLKKGDPAIPDSLPRFHWTHQERIFDDFIERVKVYIVQKYGTEANLTDTYWAARNISEYLRDNYNYPAPPASEGGFGDSRGNFIDFKHFHVANGPAVYKMIMTDPRFKIELHNRRSGCMAAGGVFLAVMRYMGFPARWVGTSIEHPPEEDKPHGNGVFYDLNEDGMFNGDDHMNVIHGHYTNEVYLGPDYGWQRFDATPKKPDDRNGDGLDYEDFAYLHSPDSQYELMKRKITCGQNPKAVASSLGVGYHEHLFNHAFERSARRPNASIYHKATGVYTSGCKGGQCYDFIFDHEYPQKVRGRNAIRWLPSLTFDVAVNGGKPEAGENRVTFTPRGPWAQFAPDAKVEIVLRIDDDGTITHKVLKTDIPWNQGHAAVNIADDLQGKQLHVQVRKIGPEEYIGGASPRFSLP